MAATKRVCPTPGCPNLTNGGKCKTCKAIAEKARGSSTTRGYGSAHQRERKTWEPVVQGGWARCRRCRRPLAPDEEWHLGHPDAECPRPTAPECVPCNTSAPRRIGARNRTYPPV